MALAVPRFTVVFAFFSAVTSPFVSLVLPICFAGGRGGGGEGRGGEGRGGEERRGEEGEGVMMGHVEFPLPVGLVRLFLLLVGMGEVCVFFSAGLAIFTTGRSRVGVHFSARG